jgi:hypothetical protein
MSMSMKKKEIFFTVLLFALTTVPALAQAQFVRCGRALPPHNRPCEFRDIFITLNEVVEFITTTLAPILVALMIVIGGFYVLLSGSSGGIQKGKDMIKWAVIGYIIILLAWVIVNTFFVLIGVQEWTGLRRWWEPIRN